MPPRRTAQRRGRTGSSRPKDRLKRGVNQGTQPVVAFDKTRFCRVALAGPKLPSPVPALSHSAPSPLHQAIAALADRRSLSEQQTTEAFGVVMRGEATPAQIAALLMGLRVKGETAEEVAGASTRTIASRSARAAPATSSAVSPFTRSPISRAAIWAGVASPRMTTPNAAVVWSSLRDR